MKSKKIRAEVWIPLTQGKWTVIDLVDYDKVGGYSWHAARNHKLDLWYAYRNLHSGKDVRTITSLHQFLMGKPPVGKEIDHKDGDGLNNRRSSNLRFATRTQNLQNSRKQKDTTSRFKGVSFYKRTGKWRARVQKAGTTAYLGHFKIEADAAKAYDLEAKKLFGAFAKLNFL